MKPFWHPVSTVLLFEPRCFATDRLVRMLLPVEGSLGVIYGGSRMWPSLAHGDSLAVTPPGDHSPAPGDVLLVSRSGIPDVMRVVGLDRDSLTVAADADPDVMEVVERDAVLGRTALVARRVTPGQRRRSRLALDFREAWTGHPDRATEAAETVREKYESQAAHYARTPGPEIAADLLELIRRRVAPGKRVVVVGSGAGRESFALAENGWNVLGVEFSPTMVKLSIEESRRRDLDAGFVHADIRRHEMPAGSVDAVLFTYDVYSFLPSRHERIGLLRRMRDWLAPGGVVLLSARRVATTYERLILGVQWLALQRSHDAEWGDSHTRWIPNDGSLRRSYVHVFSRRALASELTAAGFEAERWHGGHCPLTPRTG